MIRRGFMLTMVLVAFAVGPMATGEPRALASPAPAAPALTVTQADDGQTVALRVGDRFLLDLGDAFNWTPAVADQSIVRLVPGVLVIRGAQGVYEALRPGETDLTAVGTLNCPPGQPCPALAILFRVHLVVHGEFPNRLFVPGLAADGAEGPPAA